ncbi:hypothetical protein F7725_004118 [Dissostichus mawsoni]|uniref:C-type lectin domain-containing protein n=1 Tax=Dissostichus mawsoni TaxID=36200 RepID=A0A7J5YC90_DISMA|nr:hypothetical protein F7725_004118 [Dissostichus mawsoni]
MKRKPSVVLLLLAAVCGSTLRPSFKYYDELKTWSEAQTFCRGHHSDLATIRAGESWRNSHTWADYQCDRRERFLCYNETLVLVKRKKTWDQALRHCRLLEAKNPQKAVNLRWNYRYDLASVLTPDDRAYARLRAGEASTDQVWTGLRLLAGQWFWTGDGEAVQEGTGDAMWPDSEFLWRPGEEQHQELRDGGLQQEAKLPLLQETLKQSICRKALSLF